MNEKSGQTHRPGIRSTALAVAFVFTLSSVTWNSPVSAAPAEIAAPAFASIDQLDIPAEMGTVAKVSLSPTIDHRPQTADKDFKAVDHGLSTVDRFVILIQDAHAVVDAQENIRKILAHLQKRYGVNMAALEGAKGRLEPILLRTFPESNVKRKILAGYESRAELSGPEMESVFQENAGEFTGMEDWSLYEKNYAAYLAAQEKKDALLKQWNAFKQTLDDERVKVYDPKLNEFQDAWEGYISERSSLIDLMLYLSEFKGLFPGGGQADFSKGLAPLPKEKMPVPLLLQKNQPVPFTELPELIASIGYEKSGKQNALEPLVRQIADEFKTKYLRGLGVKIEMNFYNRYQAFMTGQITAGQMLQYLVQLGAECGKKPKLTPTLMAFLGHTQTLSEIKGSRLYDELRRFLPEVQASLIKTPAQRELAEKYQKLFLLKNMIELELTHEDLAQYQKDPDAYLNLMQVSQRRAGLKLPYDRVKEDSTFREGLAPALEFYQAALERDQAFYGRIEAMMKDKKQKTIVVVAGGFHTSGLESILKEKGIAYAVVTPKISSLSGHENYFKVMKGDVSFKEFLKTTYFDALMRHAAKALTDALPVQDQARTLKTWRDNVIRELAGEGSITDAGKYLPYIDELLKNRGEAVSVGPKRTKEEILDIVRKELEKFKKDSFERIWKTFEFQLNTFTDGLKQLISKKDLNTQSVSALLDRASQSKPSMLGIMCFMDQGISIRPVSDGAQLPTQSRRAENRKVESVTHSKTRSQSGVSRNESPRIETPASKPAGRQEVRSEARQIPEYLKLGKDVLIPEKITGLGELEDFLVEVEKANQELLILHPTVGVVKVLQVSPDEGWIEVQEQAKIYLGKVNKAVPEEHVKVKFSTYKLRDPQNTAYAVWNVKRRSPYANDLAKAHAEQKFPAAATFVPYIFGFDLFYKRIADGGEFSQLYRQITDEVWPLASEDFIAWQKKRGSERLLPIGNADPRLQILGVAIDRGVSVSDGVPAGEIMKKIFSEILKRTGEDIIITSALAVKNFRYMRSAKWPDHIGGASPFGVVPPEIDYYWRGKLIREGLGTLITPEEYQALATTPVHTLGVYYSKGSEEHKTDWLSQKLLEMKTNPSAAHEIIEAEGDELMELLAQDDFKGVSMIAPVPANPGEINHLDPLVKEMARLMGKPWDPEALVKTRVTGKQKLQGGVQARRGNVEGAFSGDGAKMKDQAVLIIDDIATSAETLKAAADAAYKAGAKRVILFAIARTYYGRSDASDLTAETQSPAPVRSEARGEASEPPLKGYTYSFFPTAGFKFVWNGFESHPFTDIRNSYDPYAEEMQDARVIAAATDAQRWRLYINPVDVDSFEKAKTLVRKVALAMRDKAINLKYQAKDPRDNELRIDPREVSPIVVNFPSREEALAFYDQMKAQSGYSEIQGAGSTLLSEQLTNEGKSDRLTSLAMGLAEGRVEKLFSTSTAEQFSSQLGNLRAGDIDRVLSVLNRMLIDENWAEEHLPQEQNSKGKLEDVIARLTRMKGVLSQTVSSTEGKGLPRSEVRAKEVKQTEAPGNISEIPAVTPLVVETPTLNDVDRIIELSAEVQRVGGARLKREELEQIINGTASGRHLLRVYREEGVVVGYVLATNYADYMSGGDAATLHIRQIAVDRKSRRKDIASKLVAAVKDTAKERYQRLTIWPASQNKEMPEIASKWGFKPDSQGSNLYVLLLAEQASETGPVRSASDFDEIGYTRGGPGGSVRSEARGDDRFLNALRVMSVLSAQLAEKLEGKAEYEDVKQSLYELGKLIEHYEEDEKSTKGAAWILLKSGSRKQIPALNRLLEPGVVSDDDKRDLQIILEKHKFLLEEGKPEWGSALSSLSSVKDALALIKIVLSDLYSGELKYPEAEKALKSLNVWSSKNKANLKSAEGSDFLKMLDRLRTDVGFLKRTFESMRAAKHQPQIVEAMILQNKNDKLLKFLTGEMGLTVKEAAASVFLAALSYAGSVDEIRKTFNAMNLKNIRISDETVRGISELVRSGDFSMILPVLLYFNGDNKLEADADRYAALIAAVRYFSEISGIDYRRIIETETAPSGRGEAMGLPFIISPWGSRHGRRSEMRGEKSTQAGGVFPQTSKPFLSWAGVSLSTEEKDFLISAMSGIDGLSNLIRYLMLSRILEPGKDGPILKIFENSGFKVLAPDTAKSLLNRMRFFHFHYKTVTIPFTFLGMRAVSVYFREFKDPASSRKITHVVFLNKTQRVHVETTELFFVDGVYYGYGNAILSVDRPDELKLSFRAFENIPDYADLERVRAPGLSKRIYDERMKSLQGLLPQGQGTLVVNPEQFQNSPKALPFYRSLGFEPEDAGALEVWRSFFKEYDAEKDQASKAQKEFNVNKFLELKKMQDQYHSLFQSRLVRKVSARSEMRSEQEPEREKNTVPEEMEISRQALAESLLGTVLGGYELKKLLPVTTLSFVFEADLGGKKAIVKVFRIDREAITFPALEDQLWNHELRALKRLGKEGFSHSPELYDQGRRKDFFAPGADLLWIAEEYVGGENFNDWLNGKSWPEKIEMLKKLLAAVQQMHDSGISHRDLKPENIMVLNGDVRIIDFATSLIKGEDDFWGIASNLGTELYAVPGNFQDVSPAQRDIFSLGVMLWEMIQNAAHSDPILKTLYAPVIDRAIHSDPSKRYADIQSMAEAVNGAQKLRRSEVQEVRSELRTEVEPNEVSEAALKKAVRTRYSSIIKRFWYSLTAAVFIGFAACVAGETAAQFQAMQTHIDTVLKFGDDAKGIITDALAAEKRFQGKSDAQIFREANVQFKEIINSVFSPLTPEQKEGMRQIAMFVLQMESDGRKEIQRDSKGRPIDIAYGRGQNEKPNLSDAMKNRVIYGPSESWTYDRGSIPQNIRLFLAWKMGLVYAGTNAFTGQLNYDVRPLDRFIRQGVLRERSNADHLGKTMAYYLVNDDQMDLFFILLQIHRGSMIKGGVDLGTIRGKEAILKFYQERYRHKKFSQDQIVQKQKSGKFNTAYSFAVQAPNYNIMAAVNSKPAISGPNAVFRPILAAISAPVLGTEVKAPSVASQRVASMTMPKNPAASKNNINNKRSKEVMKSLNRPVFKPSPVSQGQSRSEMREGTEKQEIPVYKRFELNQPMVFELSGPENRGHYEFWWRGAVHFLIAEFDHGEPSIAIEGDWGETSWNYLPIQNNEVTIGDVRYLVSPDLHARTIKLTPQSRSEAREEADKPEIRIDVLQGLAGTFAEKVKPLVGAISEILPDESVNDLSPDQRSRLNQAVNDLEKHFVKFKENPLPSIEEKLLAETVLHYFNNKLVSIKILAQTKVSLAEAADDGMDPIADVKRLKKYLEILGTSEPWDHAEFDKVGTALDLDHWGASQLEKEFLDRRAKFALLGIPYPGEEFFWPAIDPSLKAKSVFWSYEPMTVHDPEWAGMSFVLSDAREKVISEKSGRTQLYVELDLSRDKRTMTVKFLNPASAAHLLTDQNVFPKIMDHLKKIAQALNADLIDQTRMGHSDVLRSEMRGQPSSEKTVMGAEKRTPDTGLNAVSVRTRLRLADAPLMGLTGKSNDQLARIVLDILQKKPANTDAVQAQLRIMGQKGRVAKGDEFDRSEIKFEKQFTLTGLPKILMQIFESFGMTDALAAEIAAKAMTEGVEGLATPTRFVDENVTWNRVARAAMAQDSEMLRMAMAQLTIDPRNSYVLFMNQPGNSEAEKILGMLKQLPLARLMLLFEKGKEVFLGRAWKDIAPVLPVGFRGNEAQSAAVRAIKGSNDPVLCLWFQDLGVKLGTYALTAEVGKIASPELKDLALEVARAVIVIYMSQSKEMQKDIAVHPEKMLPLLRQYGVLSCVKIGKNGQLFVDIEALMNAYVARQSVEQAA